MEIQLVGTGASERIPVHGCTCPTCQEARIHPELRRSFSAVLVRSGLRGLLVDAGSERIVDALVGLTLDGVLLSHWHSDHYTGLYALRWSRQPTPIPVFYPAAGEPDPELARTPMRLRLTPVPPFVPFTVGGLTVHPLPLHHETPTYGYLVQGRGGSLAYLSDTKGLPAETEAHLVRHRPDLVLLDATFAPEGARDRHDSGHNSVDEALELAGRIGAPLTVLIHIAHHNLPPRQLSEYVQAHSRRPVLVGRDGMVFAPRVWRVLADGGGDRTLSPPSPSEG